MARASQLQQPRLVNTPGEPEVFIKICDVLMKGTAQKRSLLREWEGESSLHLLRYAPFAVHAYSFMAHASQPRRPQLVNKPGYGQSASFTKLHFPINKKKEKKQPFPPVFHLYT